MADGWKSDPGGTGTRSHVEDSRNVAYHDDQRWAKQTTEQKRSRFSEALTEWFQQSTCGFDGGDTHNVGCLVLKRLKQSNAEHMIKRALGDTQGTMAILRLKEQK